MNSAENNTSIFIEAKTLFKYLIKVLSNFVFVSYNIIKFKFIIWSSLIAVKINEYSQFYESENKYIPNTLRRFAKGDRYNA